MNKKEFKTTAHSQNILHEGYFFFSIKRKKYKKVCAELAFVKVTFDRMVMIFFYRACNFLLYLLCSWIIAIIKEGMLKGRISHCLFSHAKCMPYLQCSQVQRYIYYISKLNNAIHVYTCWGA